MEELKELVKHHQPIIAAVIAGTCAIVAAVIRREKSTTPSHEKKPIVKLMMLSFLSLVVGAVLLAVERFVLPVDPAGPLGIHFGENGQFDKVAFANPGAVILLAGWLFVSAGGVWGFVNLLRYRTAHQKGKELASVPVNSGGTTGSIPVVRGVEAPVAKRRA